MQIEEKVENCPETGVRINKSLEMEEVDLRRCCDGVCFLCLPALQPRRVGLVFDIPR